MYRHIILLSIIALLIGSPVAAEVHVDGRIAWVTARNAGNAARFNGSLRFVARPGEREFRVLGDLGVEFFDSFRLDYAYVPPRTVFGTGHFLSLRFSLSFSGE